MTLATAIGAIALIWIIAAFAFLIGYYVGERLSAEDWKREGVLLAADWHDLKAAEFDSIGEPGFEKVIDFHEGSARDLREFGEVLP